MSHQYDVVKEGNNMLSYGIIGTSWITEEYIQGAKDTDLWSLTCVYSRTKEKGEAFAQKHGATHVFTNLEEMAKSEHLEAVYIASPNAFHYEQTKLFLENGKHVICEKPLFAQSEKVQELQNLAKEKGVIFMEAIIFMHLPQRKVLEDALKTIGKITMVKLDFCQRSSQLDAYLTGAKLPNIFNPAMETGGFMDLGIYCIYPALFLFGLPQSVDVQVIMGESGADLCGTLLLRYPNHLLTITYSKFAQATQNSEFQGTEGTISVESISRLANILHTHQGKQTLLHGEDAKSTLMFHEAKDFYHFITDLDHYQAEYSTCTTMALSVATLMENVRKQAGIVFQSDINS